MLTLPIELEQDDRAPYRPYRATVDRILALSPSLLRVTFTGPDFEFFATHGLDQRVKVVLPVDGRVSDIGVDDDEGVLSGDWYSRWRDLPAEGRSPFRTYTVRAVRPQQRELDIDFVSHGDGGPAARWLLSAAPGDELVIVGPDARSRNSAVGMDWHPGTAREVLLAGDETAAPAICSILESLPAGMRARAFIEMPHRGDVLDVTSAADIEVTWLAREAATESGLPVAVRAWLDSSPERFASAVASAVQQLDDVDVDRDLLWDSPEESAGTFYAWLAGESAIIKGLRRMLVSEFGIDRKRVAFMGYWRLGKSEAQG